MDKPIIVIGLFSRPDLRRDAASELLEAGYEDLAYRLADEDGIVHFDMDALPERGDALDYFDEGSAVIAHHLYYDDPTHSRGRGRDFFYNVKNNQIVALADEAGVPLFIFGDYPMRARRPDRKLRGLRVYLPRPRKNPDDLRGHYIPEKYLAGLPPRLRAQRIQELSASRTGQYGYAPLPTDIAARKMGLVKKSQYTRAAEERGIAFNGDYEDTAARALRYYGVPASRRNVQTVARELEKVYKKGLAAWQTGGHRPGASQGAWGYARVASVLVGGKAAYTADKKNVAQFPAKMRQGIERQRVYRPTRRNRGGYNLAAARAEVQAMIDRAPPSWRAEFQAAGLGPRPTVNRVVNTLLEKTAGGNEAGPRGGAGRIPPDAVRADALKGVRLSYQHDYAGWDGIGLARAMQLATQERIWPRAIDRMYAFFKRNRRYLKYDTFGDDQIGASSYLAWLNWGGTPGYRWAAQVTGRELVLD